MHFILGWFFILSWTIWKFLFRHFGFTSTSNLRKYIHMKLWTVRLWTRVRNGSYHFLNWLKN